MFVLQQNSGNTITLSLDEKKTLLSPNYLFRLISDDTNNDKIFISTDLTAETRYNLFTITLTGSTSNEELTGGTISISPNGWWKYFVYEQSSNTNLQLSGTTSLLENGKVFVSGVTIQPIKITYTDEPTTNNVYES